MKVLQTFPFSDPNTIQPHCRLVRLITVPNCSGPFPIAPFFGIQLPSSEPEESSDPREDVYRRQLFGGQHPMNAPRTSAGIAPRTARLETRPLIGLGFYWWMGKEVGREFFGFPMEANTEVGQRLLSRERILRALYALRRVPAIDVEHSHDSNTLALCWAIARKQIVRNRVEKLVEHLGDRVVSDILSDLRRYRLKGRGKELGNLRDFLHAAHLRSSR